MATLRLACVSLLSLTSCGPSTTAPSSGSNGPASTGGDTTGSVRASTGNDDGLTSTGPIVTTADTPTDDTGPPVPWCDSGAVDGFQGDGVLMTVVEWEVGAGDIEWSEEDGNFASCMLDGDRIDLRFAPSANNDGLDGCYVEFVICGYDGTAASFLAAADDDCATTPSVTIRWRGAADIYTSTPNTDESTCLVNIEPMGDQIFAEIACAELSGTQGGLTIIQQGAFACTL